MLPHDEALVRISLILGIARWAGSYMATVIARWVGSYMATVIARWAGSYMQL